MTREHPKLKYTPEVILGAYYDTLTLYAINPTTQPMFVEPIGPNKSKALTNMHMSGRLPDPINIEIRQIVFLFQGKDTKKVSETSSFELWIGCKLYAEGLTSTLQKQGSLYFMDLREMPLFTLPDMNFRLDFTTSVPVRDVTVVCELRGKIYRPIC